MSLLQPGVDVPAGATYLPATPDHVLWGRLPCAEDRPVLTIDAGTDVVIDTISHEGILEDQGRDPKAFFGRYGVDALDDAVELANADVPRTFGVDGPHVTTGPIAVRGATVGDVLAMTLLETAQRAPYGVISNRHDRGALPGEYPREGDVVSVFARAEGGFGHMPYGPDDDRTVRFPLAPFLGIMGVAVPGGRRPHSVPPGPHGGNIDISLLTVGSTLYLPVLVDDALAYVGDPHFAQGDGEVALTAMEAPLRATMRFDVIPREDAIREFGELLGPLGFTYEYLVPTGMDEDLDVAVQNCVRAAIALLQARFGMDPAHAYAYLSAATDFNISQVVDLVKGVHARIRMADFA